MELNEEQIKEVLSLPAKKRYIKNNDTAEARNGHSHSNIVEVYADTRLSCGDQRKQVFGICIECETQIYHHEVIMALTFLYPIEFVE